jgi:hypothetical protein
VNRAPHRYIVEQQITVRTSRVDQVAVAAQKSMQLLQKGIALNSNPGQGLAYKFTGLNSIKPDMITEATRNARAAADRFASDSGAESAPFAKPIRACSPFCPRIRAATLATAAKMPLRPIPA